MPDGFTTTDAKRETRPLFRELPPPSAYPVEALGPLHHAAVAVHMVTQAPMALCAQSVLAAAALAVQAHHDVILPGGGRKPLTHLFLSIAESGERKSSVDRLALRAVAAFEEDQRARQQGGMKDFLVRQAAWQAASDTAKKAKKGRDEIEAALRAVGDRPKPPPEPMVLVPNFTPDALELHLQNCRPWAGIFTAEGGIFAGGHAMKDDMRMRTGALLNLLWDGEPLRRTRIGTGNAFLPGRRCSAHIMGQPVVADALLNDPLLAGLGLLARLLVVAPVSTAGTRMFRDYSSSARAPMDAYNDRIRHLLDREPAYRPKSDDALDPTPLQCEPEAVALWIAFHDAAETAIGDGGEWRPIRAWGAKAAEHAGRLSAVLTAYAGEDRISGTAMANGITLAQHYAGEMLRLVGHAGVTAELRAAQALLDWWKERGGGDRHLAELYQLGPAPIRNADTARAACRILEEHGHITALPKGTSLDSRPRREAWTLAQ